MISRVYLEYHTVTQVICGYLLGIMSGSIWYHFTEIVGYSIGKKFEIFLHYFFKPLDTLWVVELLAGHHATQKVK